MPDPLERTGHEAPKDEMDTELKDWDGDCLLEIMRPLKEASSLLNDRRAAVLHLDTDPEERTGRNSLKDKLDAELKDLAGDCVKVMRLLKDDLSLLKERALAVLHLGVSRGCVAIVEQVLKFYTGEDILGDKSEMDKQGVKPSTDEGINASRGNEDAPTVAPDEVRTDKPDKTEHSGADPSHSQDDAIRVAPDKGTGSNFLEFKTDLAELNEIRPVLHFDELIRAKYMYSGPAREFDALGVAVVNGNVDVLALLLTKTPSALPIEVHREQLRKITEGVVERIKGDPPSLRLCQSIFDAWTDDREFNFLFWDFDLSKERVSEYLFHFLFTKRCQGSSSRKAQLLIKYLWREAWQYPAQPGEEPLWQSLLKLHDAQGRTPLHVAVDEGSISAFHDLSLSMAVQAEVDVFELAIKAPDGLGRTVWHRAAVVGNESGALSGLLRYHYRLSDECRRHRIGSPGIFDLKQGTKAYGGLCEQPMDPFLGWKRRGIDLGDMELNSLSVQNGFPGSRKFEKGVTPLHSTIMNGSPELWYGSRTFSAQDKPFWCSLENGQVVALDALELATLTGEVDMVKRLLHLSEQARPKTSHNRGRTLGYGWLHGEVVRSTGLHWPTMHVAASFGNYKLLRAYLESKICDPYIEDHDERTVLHAVLDPKSLRIQGHLLDFVNVKYIVPNYLGPPAYESTIVERQGCINLLLQFGCDIFKVDEDGQAPYPKGSLSTNEKFLSWWYDRQLKEFSASQNAMSFATNAISVMATLVATASYVGPLQPPLGYSGGDGPNQIQARYIWVRIFIVCDTLSFYLAVAAITFSLIPALPMPQQPMAAELEKTRGMIILAVATLFPSIVCILLAFAAGSIVVISANGISSLGGNLTIITASVGGAICLIGFLLLSIRLLGIIFPRTRWVRKIYDVTSVLLQRGITSAWVRSKVSAFGKLIEETWDRVRGE